MGQQDGVIKLKGRVGELATFKGRFGYQARTKTGMNGSRIKNDPRFQRTRENAAEFARGGVASRVLRTAFRTLLKTAQKACFI